jgi:hypothetical protein
MGSKDFTERFSGVEIADASAALKHHGDRAGLQQSALIKAIVSRQSEPPAVAVIPAEHPAFAVVLAQETIMPPVSGLPSSGPLPMSRPALARLVVPVAPAAPAAPPTPATGAVLAFARPDNPMRELAKTDAVPWPDRGGRTAIYDISAGIVHMPNGEKLEAHSGIGKMRDNPDFVHVRMRGATPPSTYHLTMRESLFHGVEALRLTPANGVKPHGRDGLLAHTYMLARRGESNGCVVFKEYPRFLAAFKRGEIDKIVVVPKLGSKPASSGGKTLASLFSKGA